MPTFRCDNHVPEHIKSAVTASQTLTGDAVELFGAVGVSVQCTATNGAAGTIYIDGSNNLGKSSMWVNTTSQPVAANQTIVLTNSLVDDVTSMHKMRCRFVSSAAGNIQISINARRVTY
jgi:hypothetical protein